jgi:hypothetical protein
MNTLKITISGDVTELLIGTFSKEGADWILEFVDELKPYTDIEEVWYDEGLIPTEWSNDKYWDEFDNIFHDCGFTFYEKNDIDWFINNELVNLPKINGIYLNDKKIIYDNSKISYNIKRINISSFSDDEVIVFRC